MRQFDSNNHQEQSDDKEKHIPWPDEDIIKTPEDIQKIIDFLNKSDYDFYKEIRDESTEEEFEEFCREFPEALMVLD